MLDVAARSHIDVIFPTQEQVTVLSHQLPRLLHAGLATAVPPFASLEQVQDKLSALRTLVNPRLVEPGNALAAGTDMVSALLAVALGVPAVASPPPRIGVPTHQFLMALLGAAQHTGRRRSVLAEIVRRLRRRGAYARSTEELLPWRGDRRTAILPVAAALATLIRPALWHAFTKGAVARYALTAPG